MNNRLNVQERSLLEKVDINFLSVILVLTIVGLINLYSATHGANESINQRLFYQQLVWLSGGWVVFFIATFINYDLWRRLCWVFYGANIIALIAVAFVGRSFYGAQRWLDLGFFRYQPSETIKLAVVLVLAAYLSKNKSAQASALET